MSKVIAGSIEIAEEDVERFFQEVKDNHKQLGFWDSQSTTDKADDQFVLPNGLRLDNSLGHRWLDFNNSDTRA